MNICGTQMFGRRKMDDYLLEDPENLRHMLGIGKHIPKKDWGYRNYFAAGIVDTESMERLVSIGYCIRGLKRYGCQYYHATRLGCVAVGLNKPGIKRALKD
jgi:hypothetical protein